MHGSEQALLTIPQHQQTVHHGPGNQTQRHFERTAPVDTNPKRIILDPALDLIDHGLAIALFTAYGISHRKRHQVLVTTQFPGKLDVTDNAVIAVVERLSKRARRLGPGHRITLPGNRISDIEEIMAEEVDAPIPVGR